MAQHAEATESDLHRWFWGETATGRLVADIAAHLNATEDPGLRGIAYGIAR